MGHLFAYSLYSGIILIVLYLAYKWMLAGENRHHFNRVALWSIYAVALLWLPFTALVNFLGARADISAATAGTVTIDTADIVMAIADTPDASGSVGIAGIILWIYVIGMLVSAVITSIGLLRLIHITETGTKISVDDTERYEIVVIDNDSVQPFSWHRYIVMSRSDMESACNIIITHELAHLRHRHWIDLLVAQIIATVMWYNPAAWLMRRELSTIHEYQADEAVLNSGVTMRDYQMLLIKKAVGDRFQSLANSLNHSKLKKRITMMYNQKKSARRLVRGLVFVPALAAAVATVNIPAVASAIDDASEAVMVRAERVNAHNGKVSENAAPEQAPDKTKTDKKVWEAVEQPPQYPGGDAALMQRLSQNITYPAEAKEKKIQGTVILQFVVDENGKVTDPKVVKPLNPALDAEAVRVVKTLDNFIPGKQGGKPVNVNFTLPVRFRLSESPADADKGKISEKAGPVPPAQETISGKKVWMAVEQPPQYPGGDAALFMHLTQNINYPAEAKEKKIQGTVVVQFVVDENGKVTDPVVVKPREASLDAEALRVVKTLDNFIPGKQDGKNVNVSFILPVRFKLTQTAPTDSIKTADTSSSATE